jgi:hypothetical protein
MCKTSLSTTSEEPVLVSTIYKYLYGKVEHAEVSVSISIISYCRGNLVYSRKVMRSESNCNVHLSRVMQHGYGIKCKEQLNLKGRKKHG